MHSRLFQIEKSVKLPVEELYICDPCQIREECDWFSDTVTWEEDLISLDRALPEGCFTREGNTLTLVKPLDEYLETFLDEVKLTFNLITPKMLGGIEWYKAMRKLKNNNNDFCIYSGYFSRGVPIIKWLMEEVSQCKVGDTFKIITIINYHF